MRKIFIFTFLICYSCSQGNLFSQSNESKKQKIALWFGSRDFNQPPLSNSTNLDFIDYFISSDWTHSNYKYDYLYLGFSYYSKWNSKWDTDLKVTLNSGFTPNTILASTTYYALKHLGISFTYYAYPQLLNDFSRFYVINQPNYYTSIDQSKGLQWSIYDHNISLGIITPIDVGFFHLKLGIDGGISMVSTFKNTVNQKEINSNFQQQIEYTTLPSSTFFISPKVELDLDCGKFEGKSIGFQIQSNWLSTKKAIDYKMTTYCWTIENQTHETIKGMVHQFDKFEFDVGLYYKW
jgi:hypothetical protein